MERTRSQFEQTIRSKLQQRCSSRMSEETFLLKAFRFFDTDDSKTVSRQEWQKAIEKVGVVVENPRTLDTLFTAYDTDSSGFLDYEEFIAAVFGPESGVRKRLSPSKAMNPVDQQRAEDILAALRERLMARGARGLTGLARQFRIMDDDNSGALAFPEFSKALRDYRMPLEPEEALLVFQCSDKDSSGCLEYSEFVRALRGPLNPFRRGLIAKAFKKLDADNSGIVDITDIRHFYNAHEHPDVRSGRRTEDEVLNEFLDTFEVHHSVQGQRDHRVTYDEFEEYYCNVSASIDSDQYFEVMMNSAWQLTEAPAYTRNTVWASHELYPGKLTETKGADQRSQFGGSVASTAPFGTSDEPVDYSTSLRPRHQAQQIAVGPAAGVSSWPVQRSSKAPTQQLEPPPEELIREFKEKIAARGARGFIGLARQFRIMDDNNNKLVDFSEFAKGLRDFRVSVPEENAHRLFCYFDVDSTGTIDYEEFIHRIRGGLNERRKQLVTEAFNKLDHSKDGIVTLDDIKGIYNADMHPDVCVGKKTEDEVLCEFLDTFEVHHSLYKGGARDSHVSLSEFEEYYSHISASIDDDKYFELMLRNAWNFKSQQKGWRGTK